MTKTFSIVFVLGLWFASCGAPEDKAPTPAPAAPVAKPAPAPAPAPTPTAAPVPKPAVDPMVAANALFEAKKYAEAAEAYAAITKAHPDNGLAWFNLGYSLHSLGKLDQAMVAHAKAAEFPEHRAIALYNLGCAQALTGQTDAAFETLNKSIDSGFDKLNVLKDDPDLKSLRADPRYTALVQRLEKPKA